MREILFRGKRLDNGEWVEGAYCPKNCDSPFGPMIDKPSIIKLDDPFSGFWFDVDPSTVGQYTGLCDKNGKKIFEGDIVLVSWSSSNNTVSETYVVVYSKSGFFCKDKERLLGQLSNYVYRNAHTIQCEVIGNIHDNTELLEDVGR